MPSGRDIQVALIGQPNVGKSSLFTRLTGVGVISSNYPGTTVEFEEATVLRGGGRLHVHDLPGTYSLSTNSADEDVVIDMLLDSENDAVVLVADAMNLESGLALCIEVMELGIPVVVALNRIDVAVRHRQIDIDGVSRELGVPVIPVSAKTGQGIEELLDCLVEGGPRVSGYRPDYDDHIIEYAGMVEGMLRDTRVDSSGLSIKLLEGAGRFAELITPEERERVEALREEFLRIHGDSIDIHIAKDRFAAASGIVDRCVTKTARKRTRAEVISDYTITPSTGIPILALVILGILAVIIYGGSWISGLVEEAYGLIVGDILLDFGESLGGDFWPAVMSGLNESFIGILTLVIPYIMVFYIILGILEDTGYLPRVVVLLDSLMHRFGLHGGGFIPLIVGLGCNVPAVLATRSLSSRRERLIACCIIVMAVPCSAQIAIIFGATGAEAGIQYALLIMGVLLVIGMAAGLLLNRKLPSEPSSLAMEIPDLTVPQAKNVLFKMWSRTKDFFSIAVPLLIAGGVVIELLIAYNLLDPIVQPLSFITEGMLGLPAVAIVALLMGIIRKEMAYAILLVLLGGATLTPDQFVVFGVVMAIYMPCLATLAVMGREIGWKDTAVVALSSIVVAILVGTAFNYGLRLF